MKPAHSPQNIFYFPLPDGPLIAPRKGEDPARVFRMAADLIEADAFRDHRAAFQVLVMRGHNSFLVGVLIDDARQLAMQAVVAAEMSAP